MLHTDWSYYVLCHNYVYRGACNFSVVDLNKNTDVTHGDVAVVLSGRNFFFCDQAADYCPMMCYLLFEI